MVAIPTCTSVSALGLTYVAGIFSHTTVWTCDTQPLPPKKWSGQGRPTKRLRRDRKHQPIAVKELALKLPKRAWRTIKWREGSAEMLSSRFARVRVHAAHRDDNLSVMRPEEWLLIEWPEGEDEPTKYWLSTLPKDLAFPRLVDLTKLRWRIERDYQELKQELGLGHFEGRGWGDFITTPRCASLRMDSWSPSGRRFPPADLVPPGHSRNLPFPLVTDPEAPPIRPERHIPNSVATMRRRLIIALTQHLSGCPCCTRPIKRTTRRVL
jgi:hypothetical protein